VIDVSELLVDPDFSTNYIIWRTTGEWVNGRFVEDEPQRINFYGPVQPPTAKDLELMPEADRVKGIMNFLSQQPIYITRENAISDIAEYNGERYKITQVKNWYNWNRATGMRI
jgi:hypothetical protein